MARPALNGDDEETGIVRPHLVATQLECGNLGCLCPQNTGSPQIAAGSLYPYRVVGHHDLRGGHHQRYRLLRHEYKRRLTRSERRDKRAHGPTRRGTLIVVLACEGIVPRDSYGGPCQRLEVNADGTTLGQEGGVRHAICGYAQDHAILIARCLVLDQPMARLERSPLIQGRKEIMHVLHIRSAAQGLPGR
jgi:hypothetical protein